MRPTLLAAALLAVGLHAPDALALGLGAITPKSVIGEPFRAEVALLGGNETLPGSNCFSLDTPTSANADDLPWLMSARIRTQGRTVFISSPLAINEPILMVGLKIGCGFELAREYTVLMQPAGTTAEVAAAPAVARSEAPVLVPSPRQQAVPASVQGAAAPAVAEKPRARASRKAAAREARSGGDRLSVAPSIDAGNGMKMSAGLSSRPEATEAQRDALRTEQRLLAALDEQIATHLAIAEKVKHLEARLSELQKQLGRTERTLDSVAAPAAPSQPLPEISQSAPASPPPYEERADEESEQPAVDVAPATASETAEQVAPPAGLTNEPVRVINKLPPEAVPSVKAAAAPGVNWLVAALGALAAGSVLAGTWLWRRRAGQRAATAAVRQRHAADALSSLMADRPTGTRKASAVAPTDKPALFDGALPVALPASPSRPTTSTTSIDYFPGEAPAEHMEDFEVAAGSPTAEGTTGVDFELGIDDSPSAAPRTTTLDLEFDTFVGSTSSQVAPDAADAAGGPRLVSTATVAPATVTFDPSARPANEEEAPSHEHVLELAEIMMSFGRSEGAAQTLSEFLRDYPKESLIPWLKLLDLYHSNGRRGEYDDLAPRMNRAFNVKVPDWENFSGPTVTESVEQFSHIMARINAGWPNQDCLDYLIELLRDNRAGTRVGFPLGVIDDILLLKAVLEWLIANPSITTAQVTRMALV